MATPVKRPALSPGALLLVAAVTAWLALPLAGAAAAPASQPAVLAASPAATRDAVLPQAMRVRLGEVGILGGIGYYLAMDKGYFLEQGIDVEPIHFNTTAEMTAPLAAGQLDTGGGATSAGLFNAIARGVDVKMVADHGHNEVGRPINALMVRRAAVDAGQLGSVADLRGRRIAIPSISVSAVTDIRAYVAQGGLTLNDVVLEQMAFPDYLPSLANGSVDAVIPVEPFTSLIQQTGMGTRWFWDYEVNPNHQVAVLLYAPGFVRDQPEAARRFMVAYLKGVRVFNDGFFRGNAAAREDTIQALMKWTPIRDRAMYEQMTFHGIHPDGEIDLASMRVDQEFFLQSGQQDRAIDLDASVDLQYARYARQVLGAY